MSTNKFIQPVPFPTYLFNPNSRFATNPMHPEVYCILRLDDLGSIPPEFLDISLAKDLKEVRFPIPWLTRIIIMLEKNKGLFDEAEMQNYRENIAELKRLLSEMKKGLPFTTSGNIQWEA